MDSLWAQLKQAQAGEPPDKLSHLVRTILTDGADTNTFSVEQGKLLIEVTSAALDPELVKLLSEESVTEFAPYSVAKRASNLNEVAQALAGKELLDLPERTRKSLTLKFESRSKILDKTPVSSSGSWFNTFCLRFPIEKVIQRSTWSSVEKFLGQEATTEQERAVLEIWSEGHELREIVHRFTLSPTVADLIENAGFQTITTMTKEDMLSLMKEKSNAEWSKMMRMWRCESAAGKEAEESRRTG